MDKPQDNDISFTFFGTPWIFRRDKTKGGSATQAKSLVCVNQSYPREMLLDYLMHELFEIGCVMAAAAYEKMFPGPETLFILTHDKLDMVSSQVRIAYMEIMRKLDEEEVVLGAMSVKVKKATPKKKRRG